MKCLVKPASASRRWVFVKLKRSTFFWKKKEQPKNDFQKDNPEESLFSFPQNNFVDFYSKLKTTIDETMKSPSKLDLLIKEKGADKILSELEGINKIIKEGKSGNETFRYMDFTEFLKYKQANEGKMKFVMPLFWGWAFPVVKYCSVIFDNDRSVYFQQKC